MYFVLYFVFFVRFWRVFCCFYAVITVIKKQENGLIPSFLGFKPISLWQGQKDLVSPAGSVGPGRSPPGCRPPRHAPQAGLRAHLVAKSYRTLTKKSGIADAIPDFLAGAEGLGLVCRLGRAWTQPTGLQAPTTRTTGGPAGTPRCQILPHANEKVRHRRCDT